MNTMSTDRRESNEQLTKHEVAIAVLQGDMGRAQKDITLMLTNHLPHLQKGIDELDKKLDIQNDRQQIATTEIKVAIAKYIGIAIGAMAIIQLLLSKI